MMDGRCESCRWWDRDDHLTPRVFDDEGEWIYPLQDWGRCAKAVYWPDGHADVLAEAKEHRFFVPARYCDVAELLTAPDFGCVQWEQREE